MKVKGTGSRCLLEECVKDNYYARFYPHGYHCCKEMKFISRLDINFLDSTQIVDGRTNGRKVEPLYRTLLKAGAIKKPRSAVLRHRLISIFVFHRIDSISCLVPKSEILSV